MNTHIALEGGVATTAELLIEALQECGVSFIFANLGSDHTALIEAMASARERGAATPAMVICPHEMSALSAAHGYALACGRAQAVFVHTDVGTANLGGSVHNASRSRIPVLIFAGLTPYTLEGELPGSRNSQVNHMQELRDQHGLVRSYVKWSYDIRTGRNVKQLVYRALQLATSSPCGPVYLTGAREVLAELAARPQLARHRWTAIARIPAPDDLIERMVDALARARHPLIVTSYLGRNAACVPKLVQLAERLGVAVVETVKTQMNFPADHPLHIGYAVDDVIADADVILALDTDSPWIQSRRGPSPAALIYFVDADPLKEDLPLWYMPSDHFIRADSEIVLDQLLLRARSARIDAAAVASRTERYASMHRRQRDLWARQLEQFPADKITVELVCSVLNRLIDENTVIVNETITNLELVFRYLPRNRPGTMLGNGGTSLGWSGGAAIGVKLAAPDRTVVSLVGDGTYFFSVPASTYWIAKHYATPFLCVILDNGGWNATKQNVRLQYPGGAADRTDRYWVNLAQTADLPGIASAAGGAFAATITQRSELEAGLSQALDRVAAGQPAVVSVRVAAISEQPSDRA